MIRYTQDLKSKIFKVLNNNPNAFNAIEDEGYNGIVRFLNNIWDLKALPSPDDSRWSNAYDDAVQHLINNDDWSFEYAFIERFNLLEIDEVFTRFLETVVHPDFRNDLQEIEFFVAIINVELASVNYTLAVSDYKYDLPVYTLRESKKNDKINVLENSIPFIVGTHFNEYPYFHLKTNDWDDYGCETTFKLLYFKGVGDFEKIGDVKITNGESVKTRDVIDEKFTALNDSFCSLGQELEYYENLQRIFRSRLTSVLFALKDAAYFVDINDKFSSNAIYRDSLTRGDYAEQLSRNIKLILQGISPSNRYSFTYTFTPNYASTPVEIDLGFNDTLEFSDRIFAIIGKNGAGKTQLITSLPLDISESKVNAFKPHKPIFSKIIAVSYSVFDSFQKPNENIDFNYVFCGLLNDDKTLPSKTDKNQKLIEDCDKIIYHKRVEKWKDVLSKFIDEDVLEDAFIINEFVYGYGDDEGIEININNLIQIVDRLSSGQSIMLEIMTKIIANIRYDSLILFDEPETHLHPNAISQLISSIYELVESFDSYCLITTHSPIIIQNIFGKNVYVMEKDNNSPILRKIGIESFGENLTVLTEDVFSNSEINKQYKVILDKIIEKYYNYETILEKLENDNLPLSLNAKIYIKSKLL